MVFDPRKGRAIPIPPLPEYVREGNKMKSFLLDDTGLELSEYAVAAALLTIAVAGAFTTLGGVIAEKINVLVTRVTG